MRFFRYNNHLLWVGVLIFVSLCVYGVMYLVQKRNTTSHHSVSTKNSSTSEVSTNEEAKRVQFAEPIEEVAEETQESEHTPPLPQFVFLDVAKQDFLKDPYVGKIVIQLHPDVAPKTCLNFAKLCEDKKYVNTPFHRVIKDFMLQGGDIVHQDGTGTYSIYGGEGTTFEDEAFVLKHDRAGTLSMANSGPNTNGSQFFITTRATSHLDGKHVVFGHVVQGIEFVHDIEREMTDANDSPIRKCYILNCGVIDLNEIQNTQQTNIQQTATQPPSQNNSLEISQMQQHTPPEHFSGVQPMDSNLTSMHNSMSPIHNNMNQDNMHQDNMQMNQGIHSSQFNQQSQQSLNMSPNQTIEPAPFSI